MNTPPVGFSSTRALCFESDFEQSPRALGAAAGARHVPATGFRNVFPAIIQETRAWANMELVRPCNRWNRMI